MALRRVALCTLLDTRAPNTTSFVAIFAICEPLESDVYLFETVTSVDMRYAMTMQIGIGVGC